MIRYLFSILCCLFISACALPEEIEYDYDQNAPTIGLTVTPKKMELTPDKVGSSYSFELRFSTDELLLKAINEPIIDDPTVFSVAKPSVEDCKSEVANTGKCTITVQYLKASGSNNSKGSITLEFDYINDMNPEGHKSHILHFSEIPLKSDK